MKNFKKTIEIGLLTLFAFVLAIQGLSTTVAYAHVNDLNASWMPNSVTSSTSFAVAEQTTGTTDKEISASSKKAKDCKDVIPLEKVTGLPKFFRNITGDRKLRPKDKVPEFTLPQMDGEKVVIYDVLAKNDYVLIDFWATACGPCVAQFPKLKEIHSTYSEVGFEIISICTDLTHEQWEESSEEYKLPWVDVGEINDEFLGGPTSKTFRLSGLPRSYLVDTNGCILHTHIFPRELEQFLKSQYDGERESQETGESQEVLETKAH